jgi:N-acetylmuramoyl-L-alanine amidase
MWLGPASVPICLALILMLLSPNFGERRDGLLPSLVVLHYTAMESCAAACARLCDPDAEVSAHYIIDYDGQTHALVAEENRAWHAGAGMWQGLDDINSRSIGIELANSGAEPFAAPQMHALETLLRDVMARWAIPPQNIIAHSDMAPGRKSDPGARFDWRGLALQGLSVWPTLGNPDADLEESLTGIGYPDGALDLRLAAFRLRFRPMAKGAADATDRALADGLARLHLL